MRSLVLFTCLALSTAPVPATQGRDGGQFTIAVHVDLVVFNVTVTDSKGRYVPGLTLGDFRVSEDHRAQDITLFSNEEAPASVGLVIDNSGSMRQKRADVVTAVLVFTKASDPGDELFVVTFNERATLGLPPELPFTNDEIQIRTALLRTLPDGMTALYDALVMGIQHLTTGTRDRKALVVVSDGGDNASRHRLEDLAQLAQQSSATIYAVGIYDDEDRDQNPGVLRKIAAASGGRAYFPQSLGDLEGIARNIAGGIRHQYTLGYYSSNTRRDGAFRKVTITARRDGGQRLQVTTRDGYRAPTGVPIPR